MGGYMNKKIMGPREDTAEQLQSLLDEHGFRAKKDEWTDIPDLTEMDFPVEMTRAQAKVYNDLMSDMFAEIDGGTVAPQIVLTKLLRLQQVSSGFVTVEEESKIVRLVDPKDNPKVHAVRDLMAGVSGKVIIFTLFRETVDILRDALAEYNPSTLVGGQKDVEEHKERFESDPACRAIIVQQQAGKYGHTLLGGGDCSTSIFVESSWSLDTRLQALARNHRHGQTKKVTAYSFTSSPVETAVLRALSDKETTAEGLVDRFKAIRQQALDIS
jgi:SNF2 family DNA or RNA helicase